MPVAVILLAAGILAYLDSFSGPFVFDGAENIQQNLAIRKLWPPWAPMAGTNRPLGLWSFALNYALGGLNVWGYHAANLAIHLAAAMVLWGIVRRTLSHGRLAARFAAAADGLALVVALLWLLHPLQTQSVTYIYQRFESLMGLWFLLTLYCFIRGAEWDSPIFANAKIGTVTAIRGASAEGSGVRGQGSGPDSHPSSFILPPLAWYAGSVACCLLAVMTKEVAAVAPLLVLWYDRAFVASSWREIFRRRWAFYGGLAGTWPVLAAIIFSQAGKYPKAGLLVVENLSPLQYALSQPAVIAHYLRLCFWPTGLCLDYGWPVAERAAEILPPLLLIGALLALTVWAVFRWPAWGFLGGWFFLILAPTSSVFPIKNLAFEHRMYLPLAAVATGVVLGGWVAGQWLVRRATISLLASQIIAAALVPLAAVALGVLTFRRNLDYRSDLSIWEDTVAKAPNNAGARYNLAKALAWRGQFDRALTQYQKILEIKPDYAEAHNNLATIFVQFGRVNEAIDHYRKSLQIRPAYAKAHNNLGVALMRSGGFDEAIVHFEEALKIKEDDPEARDHLDMARSQRDGFLTALARRCDSLRARPDDVASLNDTARLLATNPNASIRNGPQAVEFAERAAQLSDRRDPTILDTLAAAYAEAGRFPEAVETAPRPSNWPSDKTSRRWPNPSRPGFTSTNRKRPITRCNRRPPPHGKFFASRANSP